MATYYQMIDSTANERPSVDAGMALGFAIDSHCPGTTEAKWRHYVTDDANDSRYHHAGSHRRCDGLATTRSGGRERLVCCASVCCACVCRHSSHYASATRRQFPTANTTFRSRHCCATCDRLIRGFRLQLYPLASRWRTELRRRLDLCGSRDWCARGLALVSFCSIVAPHMRAVPPNPYALQRTRPSRSGCKPRVPRAGSLSLGRWAEAFA
jgi:hypothetical protein